MSYVVAKQGHDDWTDLIGKEISFEWSDGWEEYSPRYVCAGTQTYAEDPHYPRYYVLDENGGGYSFWEREIVQVTVW